MFLVTLADAAYARKPNRPAAPGGLPVHEQPPAPHPPTIVPDAHGFDAIKAALAPVHDAISYIAYVLIGIWDYLMNHPPAAVITSAVVASTVAIVSINKQREIARLKETFATLDRGNWDKDMIDARYELGKLRIDLKASGESIAKFAVPAKKDTEIAGKLYNILNDYENIAIAVRMDILDEIYLFRWMRGVVISDWDYLSPLVTSLRHDRSTPALYIEFEGLAGAWNQGKPYGKRKHLSKADRKVFVS